ncbi:MAG: hypothetical protein KDI61_03970 [Alphaproteobacteria bacterium]|nr:hypothetical protein [Alphaproteobacteria bacterium]
MERSDIDTQVWQHKDRAVELTSTALNHYFTHRQIVLKKLKLAQTADQKYEKRRNLRTSIGMTEKLKAAIGILLPFQARKRNKLWGKIIELFSTKAIYEDDLFKIEEFLEKMPKEAHDIFLKLTKKDRYLKKLQTELNREGYIKTKKIIREVQKHKNPLTGMNSEDYERNLLQHLKNLLLEE